MSNLVLNKILQDIRIQLADEFDRNFERKGFYDSPWQSTKIPNPKGTLMLRTGHTRRSIRSRISGGNITFGSSLPWAKLHNDGGEVTVTPQMIKYCWAMYYKASGGITISTKTKAAAKTKRNERLSAEAEKWKALALRKPGSKMHVPARRFIGYHSSHNATIRAIASRYITGELHNILNRRK